MKILGQDNGRHIVETAPGVIHWLSDVELAELRIASAPAVAPEPEPEPAAEPETAPVPKPKRARK